MKSTFFLQKCNFLMEKYPGIFHMEKLQKQESNGHVNHTTTVVVKANLQLLKAFRSGE